MRTLFIDMVSQIPPKDVILRAITYTLLNASIDDKRMIYNDIAYTEGMRAKERNKYQMMISEPLYIALKTEAVKFKVDMIWIVRASINYYRRYEEKIKNEIANASMELKEFVYDPIYASNLYVFYNNVTRVIFAYFNDTTRELYIANQIYEVKVPFFNDVEYEDFKKTFMASNSKLSIVYKTFFERIITWSIARDIASLLYEDYLLCKKQGGGNVVV